MNRWQVANAKAHFSAVLREAGREPQIICCRNQPRAALIDIDLYTEMRRTCERKRPQIGELLAELREIQGTESAVLELPPRANRGNPLEEILP